MKKGDQSKHHLIECAARLFWHDGYNATGINKILQESEMTKGSFYFYFKTKKELAAAVISYYQQVIFEWLQELSQDTQWEEFVRQFSSRMLKDAADGRHYGCPFAVVGMEIAFAEPDISPCYAAALENVAAYWSSRESLRPIHPLWPTACFLSTKANCCDTASAKILYT